MSALQSVDPDQLSLTEVFGPTLQGEGPAAGMPAMFVRFAGCNLSCSWCDTPYTWDADRYNLRDERYSAGAQEIAAQVIRECPRIVVLTGGEPLLQQQLPAWQKLLQALTLAGKAVHLESNGTILPSPTTMFHLNTAMVSPKFGNAGEHRGHQNPALHPGWAMAARTHPGIHLKIVCQTPAEVADAAEFADTQRWPAGQVWVMPEGKTAVELAERWPAIANAAARNNVNASHRLHVLAWGTERGH